MVVGAVASPAMADHDWVVNINDAGFDPIAAGGVVAYTVRVGNDGPDAAPATFLAVDVPAGTVMTGTTGAVTGCSPLPAAGPATVQCPIPALNDGQEVDFSLLVETSQKGTVNLAVSLPDGLDTDAANNSATESTTVNAGADLSVTVAGPAVAASGSQVDYTFTVLNDGPDPVDGMVLEVPLPLGLSNIQAPAGCALDAGTFLCVVPGPLAVGGNVDLVFGATVDAASGSNIQVVGSIGDGVPLDPISANNTGALGTTVSAGSDVRIAKARSPSGALLVGDEVIFTLTGSYTGDSPTGLSITDTIPANYEIVSVTPQAASGWTCAVTGQVVSCDRATGDGAGNDIDLGSIEIVTTAISAGGPSNVASISAAGPADPVPGNNTATDGGAVIVPPMVDLRGNKTGPSPALVVVGNTYEFGLSASNDGNAPFYGTVQLTENLPAGLTATAYDTPAGWSCLPAAPQVGPAAITCERVYTSAAPLAPNATTPAIGIHAEATQSGQITNTIAVASPDANLPDGNPGNDGASYSVTASFGPATADIAVLKSAAQPTLEAGAAQTFRIEITNAGPQPATAVTLTDDLVQLINSSTGATGAGIVSVQPVANLASGMSCATSPTGGASARLSCDIATLPVCTPGSGCPYVEVTVRPGGDGGPRTNTARAMSSDVADPVLSNNAASASFTLTPKADVALTKQGSPLIATAGQELTWILTAENLPQGLSAAENVTITDVLPPDLVFVSAAPSSGICTSMPTPGSTTGPGNDTVVCNLGTLGAAGVQHTVLIKVRPKTATYGETLHNTADVTTTTPEDVTSNNRATNDVAVQEPELDLLVNKIDSADPVTMGDDTTYTITVTNAGPSAAENVVLTDTMPATGLTYQSHSVPADGSCSAVPAVGSMGQTLQCTFPMLQAGESRDLTVVARGAAKGVHTNRVTVSSTEIAGGFDSNTANNEKIEATTVRTRADLEIVSKTADPGTVNLNDDFEFVIEVRNNTGTGLSEADQVVVSDNLPSGMRLVGTPTISPVSGTLAGPVCTGSAGATSFTCSIDTVSNGAVFEIHAPVEVHSVSSLPQTVTNTATVTTTGSHDPVGPNNTGSGTVAVGSSSISGTLYRDFGDDGARDAGDSGIGGVTLTLSGTSFDNNPVNLTATTQPDGSYSFPYIPAGIYQIARGAITESHLEPGQSIAGSEGGTAGPATLISSVTVPAATAATDYDFTVIPQARVGLAKDRIAGPTINPDGSFTVTFRLAVRNHSLEPLTNVAVEDPLAGAAPLFGTHVSLGSPAGDPMSAGSYTLLSAPSGSCGGNAGFDGSGDQTVAQGFALAVGQVCEVQFSLRVQPPVPVPAGGYLNSATVTAEGQLSGQTPGDNPLLTDISNNGTNTDPDGDGNPNEPGENTPTPVQPAYASSVALVKTAVLSGGADPAKAGDTVTYAFAITNTGNLTLSNLQIVEETLGGVTLAGGPVDGLLPGQTDGTTITGSYVLTQEDVDAGMLSNSARVSGVDPFGTPVEDVSGTAQGNDTPTQTIIPGESAIALVKLADDSAVQTPAQVGDLITYSFAVRNTGTLTLTDIDVADARPGLTLAGGPIAELKPGETDSDTFTATYAVTQEDIDAGEVENSATVTGETPSGPPATDVSGGDFDDDDPTVVPLASIPAVALVKTADVSALSAPPKAGDQITYRFAITNTGTVTLENLAITEETLAGVTLSGGPVDDLAPGETDATAITGVYVVTQGDIDAGEIVNSARVTGEDALGRPVEDVSGTATGNDTPTTTPVQQQPAIALVKKVTAFNLSDPPETGDEITYAFEVTNTGNVVLTNVVVDDPMLGGIVPGGPPTLAPGQTVALGPVVYALSQTDIDAGEVTNTATATGRDPGGDPVTDISGTGVDDDTPTVAPVVRQPGIALVKSADLSALSSPPAKDGVITYAFEVTNTGNVVLTNVVVNDPLLGGAIPGGPLTLQPLEVRVLTATYALTQPDIDAGELTNTAVVTGIDPTNTPVTDISGTTTGDDDPILVPLARQPRIALVKSADLSALSSPPAAGEAIAYVLEVTNTGNVVLANVTVDDPLTGGVVAGGPLTLLPGESRALGATYTLTQADIDAGEVVNTATTTGTDPANNPVTDTSGTTTGNDDPTLTPIARVPAIELVKTADTSGVADGAEPGDPIPYTFTVRNTGNVTLTGVTISDALPGIVLAGGPIDLDPGQQDAVSFTALYTLTESDIAAGQVTNTATASGSWSGGTVTDDDTVIAEVGKIEALPETFPPFQTDGGTTSSMLASDLLNGQPVTLDKITIEVVSADEGVTLDPVTGLITLAPGRPAGRHSVTYRICSRIVATLCSEATETVVQLPLSRIEAVKTETLVDNGDGVRGVGDRIDYAITVKNTGNVAVEGLSLDDRMRTLAGARLELGEGPVFVASDMGSAAGALAIGETATYRASFEVTAAAVTAGGVENSVTARATEVFGPDIPGTPGSVSDISDNGLTAGEGDAPTVTLFDPAVVAAGLKLEKTTPRSVVQRGAAVPYTLRIVNENPTVARVDLVDVLPPGFFYIEGSARLGGVPVEVEVAGRVVTWPDLRVPAEGDVTATLSARVPTGVPPGEHVNRGQLLAPGTRSRLASAQAVVRILPEPVFDCGDVIGKVFDDRNRDGYQNQGEPGLPAVRLAGVDGTIITADRFGRFHVPCAMLPADRGSNFILKLDTRSLPAGYRVTTENPRVVRLTPGKMTEMNFGAAITRVVRIDLSDRAFGRDASGRAAISAELGAGIGQLLPQIAGEAVNLRLAFHLPLDAGAAEVKRANALMDLAEKHIRREWRGIGRVKLTIERTIVRGN